MVFIRLQQIYAPSGVINEIVINRVIVRVIQVNSVIIIHKCNVLNIGIFTISKKNSLITITYRQVSYRDIAGIYKSYKAGII